MQFGLRKLLVVVVFFAVVCALFVAARNTYYSARRQTESALAEVKGISDIKLHSHVDITEEINSISFSVKGQPASIVVLGGLTRYADDGRFFVTQVGKWTFWCSGRRSLGAYRADTGEPVESEYFGFSLELGRNSPYKKLFPFELNTLQDVVDHYAELVELFESWPREAEPGTVLLEDGTTQKFFVFDGNDWNESNPNRYVSTDVLNWGLFVSQISSQ